MPGPPHLSQASQTLFQKDLRNLLSKHVPTDSNVSPSLEGVVLFYSVVVAILLSLASFPVSDVPSNENLATIKQTKTGNTQS